MEKLALLAPVLGVVALLFALYLSKKVSKQDAGTDRMKEIVETNASRVVPKWLEMNKETLTGKVVALAQRDDIDYEVQEHLIVELYSK